MGYFRAANQYQTELLNDINATQVVIEVTDLSGAPEIPFKLSVESEIVNVIDVVGTLLTVERGAEGTTPSSHPEGSVLKNKWTAGTYKKLCDSIDEVSDDLETHKQSVTPHTYGNRFAWEYNSTTDSLDLVVINSE